MLRRLTLGRIGQARRVQHVIEATQARRASVRLTHSRTGRALSQSQSHSLRHPHRLTIHHVQILRPRYVLPFVHADQHLIASLQALTVFSPDGHLFQVRRPYHICSMCIH